MTASRDRRVAPRSAFASRIGIWLFGLILASLLIVCATLVAVFSFEQTILRPLAEHLVETATDRAFTIEGDLDARAGRIVSIRVGRISLANADWGSSDNMLSIEEMEISIDLLRLLGGMPAIENLVSSGVQLLFEQDEQGRSNWAMDSHDEQPSPVTDNRSTKDSGDEPSLPATESPRAIDLPVIHSLLTDIDITVNNAALARPLRLRIDSLEHSAASNNELRATVIGALENRPLNLQARIGPLAQLQKAGAVDFDIEADFEAITLELNGHLDNLLAPRQVSVQVSMASAEISQIFATLGLPQTVNGPGVLEASISPAGDLHRLDFAASIDSLELNAQASLQALNTIDGASITLSAGGPDLAAAAKLAGFDGLPPQAFTFESSAVLSGRQLTIGATHFDTGQSHLTAKGSMSQFPQLDGTNLELQLAGKNYLDFAELLGLTDVAELQPEAFELRTNLAYSAQDQQQFTARIKLADVSGEFGGRLTEYPAFVGSDLEFRLEGQNDALIQQLLGRPTLVGGAYRLQGKLKRTLAGFSIEPAALSFGANELQVSGIIGAEPLRSDTDLSMRFHGPDLAKIAAIAGYAGFVPAGVAEISAALRAQDKGIHVDDFALQLGRNRLNASGLVNLQAGVDGSRMKLALAGDDIADVLPPELLSLVDPQQSFELRGTLATDSEQLAISALQARLGKVSLEASGTVSMTQPLTDMSLKLDARGPDLAAIIPEHLVPYRLPAAKFSVTGDLGLTADGMTLDGINALIGPDRLRLSGTIPLDTPGDGLSLVIAASGPDLGAIIPFEPGQLEFKEGPYEISGNIQLAQRVMSLRQLDFSTPRGRLSGQLSVSLLNPRQFGQFDLRAKGDNLGEFSPSTPDYRPAAVPFDLDARGSWDSKRISIEKGVLQLDATRIELQGEVNLPPNTVASRLVLSAHGDSLADLGQFRGLLLPPHQFRVDASLQGDANALEIPRLNARIGESDLRGSLQIEFAEKPQIRIDLASDLVDLEKMLPPEDSPVEAEVPAQPETSYGRLIPQLALPVDQLNRVNLESRITLGELRLQHNGLRNIEVDISLQDGNLEVRQLQATAAEGQIIARFRVEADGDRIVTSGKLEGKDVVLGKTETSAAETSFPEQDVQLDFETEGATLRELAANLNGYAQLTGEAGRLKNSYALGLFGSFFSELLSAVNPFVAREPYTSITCFAAYAEIIDGVAEINPGAILQTDKLNIFARGQIDLNTEQIQLRFDTSARGGIGISVADFVNPFVGVSGTLTSPKLGVDPKNAMFEGGFAYATGGLSIVAKSLFNRWFGARDPCIQLEQLAQEYLDEKQVNKQSGPAAADQ